MSFMLKYAQTTFLHIMDGVLDRLQDYTSAYTEEIVIHSQGWRNHQYHVIEVIRCLRMEEMTVKIDPENSVGFKKLYHFWPCYRKWDGSTGNDKSGSSPGV